MSRSAVTRSCSTMTVSSPCFWSSAGDSVPQYAQISARLVGFQTASAPQAGHANFLRAVASPSANEVLEGLLRDPPLRADLLAFQVPCFEAGDDVGFRHAERFGRVGGADEL